MPTRTLLALITVNLFSLVLRAAELPPQIDLPIIKKHYIPNGLQINFSSRGQKYLGTQTKKVLEMGLGKDFSQGAFPASARELTLQAETKEVVNSVRKVLSDWFGFPMANFRPALLISDYSYEAQFKKFEIYSDQKIMEQLGYQEGIVIVLEIEFKKLNIFIPDIRIVDISDPEDTSPLEVGLNDAEFRFDENSPNLQIKIPLHVNLDDQLNLVFTPLEISENSKHLTLKLDYGKILVPEVQLIINGKSKPLSQTKIDATFAEEQPKLLTQLRDYIPEFIKSILLDQLNSISEMHKKGALEKVSLIDPPGYQPEDEDFIIKDIANKFVFGFRPAAGLKHTNNLSINLDAYIEDPQRPNTPLNQVAKSRGQPLIELPQDQFDVAVVLDRALINRAMELSFNRGLLKNQLAGDRALKMVTAPVLDSVVRRGKSNNTADDFARIQLRVKTPTGQISGWDSLFISEGEIEIGFDVIAKLSKSTGAHAQPIFQMTISDIDAESLVIHDQSIELNFLGRIFTEKTLEKVRALTAAQFATAVQQFRQQPTGFTHDIPLLFDFWGLNHQIKQISMDKNGFLILYIEFIAKPRNI